MDSINNACRSRHSMLYSDLALNSKRRAKTAEIAIYAPKGLLENLKKSIQSEVTDEV